MYVGTKFCLTEKKCVKSLEKLIAFDSLIFINLPKDVKIPEVDLLKFNKKNFLSFLQLFYVMVNYLCVLCNRKLLNPLTETHSIWTQCLLANYLITYGSQYWYYLKLTIICTLQNYYWNCFLHPVRICIYSTK